MQLNSIDVSITDADLQKFVFPLIADKVPMQNFAILLQKDALVLSGTVQNIVTLPFKAFCGLATSGAILTVTVQRIEAMGPAAKLVENTALNILDTKLSKFGAVRQYKSFSIDINQILQRYEIESDVTFTRLLLEDGLAHIGMTGHMVLDKLFDRINPDG